MGFYFYCPGTASASTTTVECSVPVQTYTPPEAGWFTPDNANAILGVVLLYWSVHFIFQQIKKAIET